MALLHPGGHEFTMTPPLTLRQPQARDWTVASSPLHPCQPHLLPLLLAGSSDKPSKNQLKLSAQSYRQ